MLAIIALYFSSNEAVAHRSSTSAIRRTKESFIERESEMSDSCSRISLQKITLVYSLR